MSKDSKEDFLLSEIKEVDASVKDLSKSVAHIESTLAAHKVAFDTHTAQDEKMYGELKRMNDILFANTESLKEHMAQTMLLKESVMKMDARLTPIELDRIKTEAVREWRMSILKTAAKIGGAIAGSWGLIYAALKLINHI